MPARVNPILEEAKERGQSWRPSKMSHLYSPPVLLEELGYVFVAGFPRWVEGGLAPRPTEAEALTSSNAP